MTLQCRVVFNGDPRNALWYTNETQVKTRGNYHRIYNGTIEAYTDLLITNVTLEDDNTVYTCFPDAGDLTDSINSSVVLNVSSMLYMLSIGLLAIYRQSWFDFYVYNWH